jgi:hypothetical protein
VADDQFSSESMWLGTSSNMQKFSFSHVRSFSKKKIRFRTDGELQAPGYEMIFLILSAVPALDQQTTPIFEESESRRTDTDCLHVDFVTIANSAMERYYQHLWLY